MKRKLSKMEARFFALGEEVQWHFSASLRQHGIYGSTRGSLDRGFPEDIFERE